MTFYRILLGLFALSLAFSAASSRSCAKAQKMAAENATAAREAQAQAKACAARFDALAREAQAREAAASAALSAARKAAKSAAQRADIELARAPDFPGDDCKSAQSRAQRWIISRTGGEK